jgi:hypothetical protein
VRFLGEREWTKRASVREAFSGRSAVLYSKVLGLCRQRVQAWGLLRQPALRVALSRAHHLYRLKQFGSPQAEFPAGRFWREVDARFDRLADEAVLECSAMDDAVQMFRDAGIWRIPGRRYLHSAWKGDVTSDYKSGKSRRVVDPQSADSGSPDNVQLVPSKTAIRSVLKAV